MPAKSFLITFVETQLMKEQNKEKKFIDLPEYPGGKKAFQEFQTDLHATVRCEKTYPNQSVTHRMQHNSIFEFFRTHSQELTTGFDQLNLAR